MKRKSVQKKPQPPCQACNGLCCRHIALELDVPTRKADFDNIRWYLMHETVKVGIDHSGDWLIEIPLVCRHLRKKGCAIYKKRPDICREYPGKNDFCEFEDKTSPYKILFTDETSFERYVARKKKRLPARTAKPLPPVHFTHTGGPHLP
ncbi:MAG: YkgJ family cysteine cluster protein [Chitinispirillaceae bacterium]|nr:YkgJ family cysteine cluster protein [Chitinispirillaceae bacterium]